MVGVCVKVCAPADNTLTGLRLPKDRIKVLHTENDITATFCAFVDGQLKRHLQAHLPTLQRRRCLVNFA